MKVRILGLLGLLGFCYLFATHLKLLQAGSLERFVFNVDAPLWMYFQCLIGVAILMVIRNRFGLLSINSTTFGRDFIILISIIPILALINTYIALVVFEQIVFGKNHDLYQWITTFLYEIILHSVAGLGAISYFYFSTANEIRERLSAAQLAQSQYQLKVLQQKVDPHFLFNNLNVLSALIEKDATLAKEYLANLAKLYRYILHTQNAELVPINDELDFAKSYVYLLNGRFGSAYHFDWQVSEADMCGRMIVPTTIQSLLENVIKHNAGSRESPLSVCVRSDGPALVVENTYCPKLKTEAPSETGLQNLQARYEFLTPVPFEIIKTEDLFSVRIPLLKVNE